MRCSLLLSLYLVIASLAFGLSPRVEQALESGDRGTAIELLRKELKKNKRADEERMLLGKLLVATKDYDEAVKVWMKGVRKSPLDREYLLAVANLEMQRAESGIEIPRSRGILSFWRTPADPADFRKARLSSALAVLGKAEGVEPPSLEVDVLRLKALDGLEQWGALLRRANEAIRIHGKKATLELYQAKGLAGVGRYQDALQKLLYLAELHPQVREVHAEIAKVAARTGDNDLALRSSRRAVFAIPDYLDLDYSDERYAVLASLRTLPSHTNDQAWIASKLDSFCGTEGMGIARDPRDFVIDRLMQHESEESTLLVAVFCSQIQHYGETQTKAFNILRDRGEGDLLVLLYTNAPSWFTMRGAAQALAELKHPDAYNLLIERLPYDNTYHTGDLAGALAILGDERAVEHLINVLEKPAPKLHKHDFTGLTGDRLSRVRAALALGHFQTDTAQAALEAGLANVDLAPACAAGLFRLTGDVTHLQSCLEKLEKSRISRMELSGEAAYWATIPEARNYAQALQKLTESEN